MSAVAGAGMLGDAAQAVAKKNPRMLIVDSQVHAYERNHPGRPWADTSLTGPPEVTGDEMVAEMDAAGVDAAVLVSTWSMYRYDVSYAQSVFAKHATRFRLVKPVNPSDPAVVETIADWATTKGAVAIRVMMIPNGASGHLDVPGLNRVLATAARQSLPANLPCQGQLEVAGQLAAQNPNSTIVVDHLGMRQPYEPPVPPDTWADLPKLLALAVYPNVMVKLTGVCTLSHEPFPFNDIWDPLSRIFDAFGVDRCMWGTDWTVRVKRLTYKQGVDAFLVTDRLSDSDRATLMAGTLSRVYKWWPPKA